MHEVHWWEGSTALVLPVSLRTVKPAVRETAADLRCEVGGRAKTAALRLENIPPTGERPLHSRAGHAIVAVASPTTHGGPGEVAW